MLPHSLYDPTASLLAGALPEPQPAMSVQLYILAISSYRTDLLNGKKCGSVLESSTFSTA